MNKIEEQIVEESSPYPPPSLHEISFDDKSSVVLLLLLYFLQGLPMGIAGTLDLTLQESGKLSFEEQGVYSSVSWPYSLKMLWAPLVDALFIKRFGRRKTWLIPVQFVIGLLLLYFADVVPTLLEDKPQVFELTVLFFAFFFLCATQDIAVDGWALEMLSKENLAWASTCNSVGLTFGYIVGYQGLMVLKLYEFTDLSQFMKISGVGYLICTVYLAFFRVEKPNEETPQSIAQAYAQAWQVCKLRPVRVLAAGLLSVHISFAAAESLTLRKLLAKGLKKEVVATFATLITPLSLILPTVLAKHTRKEPLKLFTAMHLPRLGLCALTALLFYMAPDELHDISWFFWFSLLFLSVAASVVSTVQFVSQMAFFAKVSDPIVGGTYMTTLNTIANLGNKWPKTVVLFLVNPLTTDVVDGYYVLIILGLAFGVAWMSYFSHRMHELNTLKEEEWRLERKLI